MQPRGAVGRRDSLWRAVVEHVVNVDETLDPLRADLEDLGVLQIALRRTAEDQQEPFAGSLGEWPAEGKYLLRLAAKHWRSHPVLRFGLWRRRGRCREGQEGIRCH